MVTTTADFIPKEDMFENKMRAFLDTALYNKPNIADATHGVTVQKIIDGTYLSAEKGCEVAIR